MLINRATRFFRINHRGKIGNTHWEIYCFVFGGPLVLWAPAASWVWAPERLPCPVVASGARSRPGRAAGAPPAPSGTSIFVPSPLAAGAASRSGPVVCRPSRAVRLKSTAHRPVTEIQKNNKKTNKLFRFEQISDCSTPHSHVISPSKASTEAQNMKGRFKYSCDVLLFLVKNIKANVAHVWAHTPPPAADHLVSAIPFDSHSRKKYSAYDIPPSRTALFR